MATTNVDVYSPGADLTAQATAPVAGGRFVKISGNRSTNGPISVAYADAAGRVAGVAKWDAAVGDLVSIARGNSRVVNVKASGAIAAFAEVQVGADGQAVTKSAGVGVGYALTAASSGAPVQVSLY